MRYANDALLALATLAVLASPLLADRQRGRRQPVSVKTTRTRAVAKPAAKPTAQSGDQVVKRIADLAIVQVTPDQDGQVPRLIKIRNQGGTTAGKFTIRVTAYNGNENVLFRVWIPDLGPIPPSGTRSYPLYTANGGLRWTVKVDAEDRVRESNESNNYWSTNRER